MINLIKNFFSQLFEKIPKIDDKNKTIGRTTRINSFIFKRPIRTVNVFILNDKNEILLQKRSIWMMHPLKWADCTGAIPSCFSAEEAALKEIKEELFDNRHCPQLKIAKIDEFSDASSWQKAFSTVFMARYNGPFRPSKLEVSKLKFMPVQAIKEELRDKKRARIYSPQFKAAFSRFLMRTDY